MFRRNKQKTPENSGTTSAPDSVSESGKIDEEGSNVRATMDGNQDASSASEQKLAETGSSELQNESPLSVGDFRTPTSADTDAIQKLEMELKETYDKYLRSVAEFENYKKRALKERSEMLKYAAEGLARDLLEIADGLQLALRQEYPGVNEELLKGVQLILNQFLVVFDRHSIRAESAVGKMFEPDKHQALATVPTKDQAPGTVLEEFKRAYFLKDKLLRAGQVVVAAVDKSETSPSSDE